MKLLKLVPDDTNIDFVRLRKMAFALTLLLSLLCVGLTFARGLNFGVDLNSPALRLPAIGRVGLDDAVVAEHDAAPAR